ncbi:MAG: hypothetical protein IJW92_09370, partial [Clostridia bacterium]|nr:hypothetical protein [Clostridia bacterium]
MKNQRMKTERKFGLAKTVAVLTMLVALVCCLGIVASAGSSNAAGELNFPGLTYENGYWTKTYDGTTDATVSLTGATAKFDDPNVQKATCIIVTTAEGEEIKVPARIKPAELSWKTNGTASVTYNPAGIGYANVTVEGYELLNAPHGVSVQVGAISFEATGAGEVTVYADAVLAGNISANYIVPDLPVTVTINPIKINSVEWNRDTHRFVYGDDGIYQITAKGKDANGNDVCALNVMVYDAENNVYYTLTGAYEMGLYGQVKKGESETAYVVVAVSPDATMYDLSAVEAGDLSQDVVIEKKIYSASISDATYLGEADLTNLNDPENLAVVYQLVVNGADIPADILSKIVYSYYDANDNLVSTNGVSVPGTYTVKVTLPSGVDGEFENYAFNVTDADLQATLTLKRNYITVGTAENPYQMILIGSNGISDAVNVDFMVPDVASKTIRGHRVYTAYSLKINGAAEGDTYTLIIPVSSALVENENCDPLSLADIYVYDAANEKMVPATEKYSVKLSDDGSYYIIENFSTENAVSFVVAPVYHAPFWVTAPGIALIILLVLLVLLVIFFIGLKLMRIERRGTNPILVIDTEGDVPAVEPVVVPDKIEDPDACLAESIDDLADALRAEVAPAEEDAADVDASEAVEESLNQLLDEASAIVLEDSEQVQEDLRVADEKTQSMVDELIAGLNETVNADEDAANADEDAVSAAVAEAMAENFNESADSTDAIALMLDEEMNPEAFRAVVDAIVADAMMNTMVLPEGALESEDEIVEEAVETMAEVAEEADATAEESVEEVSEEVAEEVPEETVEEATEETVEEDAVEASAETEAPAEEAVEEPATEEAAETEETPVETANA